MTTCMLPMLIISLATLWNSHMVFGRVVERDLQRLLALVPLNPTASALPENSSVVSSITGSEGSNTWRNAHGTSTGKNSLITITDNGEILTQDGPGFLGVKIPEFDVTFPNIPTGTVISMGSIIGHGTISRDASTSGSLYETNTRDNLITIVMDTKTATQKGPGSFGVKIPALDSTFPDFPEIFPAQLPILFSPNSKVSSKASISDSGTISGGSRTSGGAYATSTGDNSLITVMKDGKTLTQTGPGSLSIILPESDIASLTNVNSKASVTGNGTFSGSSSTLGGTYATSIGDNSLITVIKDGKTLTGTGPASLSIILPKSDVASSVKVNSNASFTGNDAISEGSSSSGGAYATSTGNNSFITITKDEGSVTQIGPGSLSITFPESDVASPGSPRVRAKIIGDSTISGHNGTPGSEGLREMFKPFLESDFGSFGIIPFGNGIDWPDWGAH